MSTPVQNEIIKTKEESQARYFAPSRDEWKENVQRFLDEKCWCRIEFTTLWWRTSDQIPNELLRAWHEVNEVKEQSVGVKTGGEEPAVFRPDGPNLLFEKTKEVWSRECWRVGCLFRWLSKNSWNRPPQLLWVGWTRSDHILPVFVFFGFEILFLVPKSSNPSKPVERILGSTITTLQQSSTALDRPTIDVKPRCWWAASWSDVVHRS